jgi:hypothetical protein
LLSGIVVSQLGRRLAEEPLARALSPEDKDEEERKERSSLGGARKRAAHLAFRPSDDSLCEPDGFFELRLVHGFGLAGVTRGYGIVSERHRGFRHAVGSDRMREKIHEQS